MEAWVGVGIARAKERVDGAAQRLTFRAGVDLLEDRAHPRDLREERDERCVTDGHAVTLVLLPAALRAFPPATASFVATMRRRAIAIPSVMRSSPASRHLPLLRSRDSRWHLLPGIDVL